MKRVRAWASFPSVGIVAVAIALRRRTSCSDNVNDGCVATNDTVKELGGIAGKLPWESWTTKVHSYVTTLRNPNEKDAVLHIVSAN